MGFIGTKYPATPYLIILEGSVSIVRSET